MHITRLKELRRRSKVRMAILDKKYSTREDKEAYVQEAMLRIKANAKGLL